MLVLESGIGCTFSPCPALDEAIAPIETVRERKDVAAWKTILRACSLIDRPPGLDD